jgi:hypothetical protein
MKLHKWSDTLASPRPRPGWRRLTCPGQSPAKTTLSTLRRYVEAFGGEIDVNAFVKGRRIRLVGV